MDLFPVGFLLPKKFFTDGEKNNLPEICFPRRWRKSAELAVTKATTTVTTTTRATTTRAITVNPLTVAAAAYGWQKLEQKPSQLILFVVFCSNMEL